MAIYKRGKTYWFEFVFEGRRFRESAKTSNRRAAEQIEAAYKVKLAKGEVDLDFEKKEVPNFKTAIAEFLVWSKTEHAATLSTTRRYETATKALFSYFGNISLDRISSVEVEKFKEWRSKQTKQPPTKKLKNNKRATTKSVIKPATVNKELACLKIIFNHFIKSDILIKNPVSRVKFLKENNEIYVVLTEAEEKLYLMACSQPLRDVAALILDCGCRPDELYQLKKQNVNIEDGYIRITNGKTKSARRTIPLSQRALAILGKRVDDAKGEYLFLGGRTPDIDKPIVKLNNAHNAAIVRAGLRKFRLYDCRHTFASRLAMNGVDLVTLAALLGHSRLEMVLRYAHASEQNKFEAIRQLDKSLKLVRKTG